MKKQNTGDRIQDTGDRRQETAGRAKPPAEPCLIALRPCPHCDGNPAHGTLGRLVAIYCTQCPALVLAETLEAACTAWNRRVEDTI